MANNQQPSSPLNDNEDGEDIRVDPAVLNCVCRQMARWLEADTAGGLPDSETPNEAGGLLYNIDAAASGFDALTGEEDSDITARLNRIMADTRIWANRTLQRGSHADTVGRQSCRSIEELVTPEPKRIVRNPSWSWVRPERRRSFRDKSLPQIQRQSGDGYDADDDFAIVKQPLHTLAALRRPLEPLTLPSEAMSADLLPEEWFMGPLAEIGHGAPPDTLQVTESAEPSSKLKILLRGQMVVQIPLDIDADGKWSPTKGEYPIVTRPPAAIRRHV